MNWTSPGRPENERATLTSGAFALFCKLVFRWRGMDLNHQPRAYEHPRYRRRQPILETPLRAMSPGHYFAESLGLFSLALCMRVDTIYAFHYTSMAITDKGQLPRWPMKVSWMGHGMAVDIPSLEPLLQLELPIKTLARTPSEKLVEVLVLILAGGRATYQADRLLRPNRDLTRAWGQTEFAQKSTLADTLDALTPAGVGQVRGVFETITRRWSQTCQHDFRTGPLLLDGDLTGLPASKHAVGSEKGYFWHKKIAPDGKWRASTVASMGRPSARGCMSVRPKVCMLLSRWCAPPKRCCNSSRINSPTPVGASMAASGRMPASTGCWPVPGNS